MRGSHHGLVGLPARGWGNHDNTRDTCHLGRNNVHQHRGRISSAASGHIDPSRINRGPARAQPHIVTVAIVPIFGQLRLMIGLNTFRCERQRIPQACIQPFISRLALRRINLPTGIIKVEPVKTLSHFHQRCVPVGTHIADSLHHIPRYVGIRLTPAIYQRVKCVGKASIGGIKPLHEIPSALESVAPWPE